MALNFPSSPTDGQIYTDSVSGNRYVYNSANTAWLYSSNTTGGASITGTSNTQVLFNYQDAIAGSNGLTFSSNTLFANTVSIQNTIASINSINFITTNQTAAAPNDGEIQWNPDEQTLDIGLANGAILQSGQEVLYYVKNQTGATILEGTVVGAVGTLGSSGRILVAPFKANNQYQSKYCIGVTTTEILNGGEGFVTHFGKVRGLDTSMYSDGQILYANATSAGSFATSLPTAPNNKITLAIVVHSDVNGGVIFVRPTFGSRLAENENLELTATSNGDLLFYNSTTTRFENNPQAAVNAGQLNGITANTIFAHANNTANAANLWSNTVSGYSNNWANTVAGYSNTWANTQYSNALAYANSVGTGANNQSGLMANASNSASTTRDGYSNNWANTVAGYANTWANTKLSNTSGVSFAGDLYFPTGNVTVGGSTTNYKLQVYGSFAANTKSFVIDHPTKEGMKLRHGSLEGPENGVYVRGKCEGSFEIDLPDYWTGLIDANSITVTLTPYGRKQNLFVRNIANNKVFIYNSDDTLPYCYYLIQAERKDVEKMIVEY